MLSASVQRIPKADLHVHLEGTITPAMVRKLAARNKIDVPPQLLNAEGESILWPEGATAHESLLGFLKAYDDATSVLKCAQDYTDITYDYLKRSAGEGCIYAEIMISAEHGVMVGLEYPAFLAAVAAGYEQAKAETGIEMRLISTCVRHYGPPTALRAAETTRKHPHPLVTGFGMAGDENAYKIADFAPAFAASGLEGRTAHAGEASGPATVREARDVLNIRRFGHMVRAIEDLALMEELKSINAVPEVCVSSNIALKVFPSYAAHPVRKFFDFGLKVTFGSDDPTFFGTSIGNEYQIAQDRFGFSDAELLQVTRNAVEEAFIDGNTRDRLLHRLDRFKAAA
jgi:adenosine deaminase